MKVPYKASAINPFFHLLLKEWQQVAHALKLVKNHHLTADFISNVRPQR